MSNSEVKAAREGKDLRVEQEKNGTRHEGNETFEKNKKSKGKREKPVGEEWTEE